jgi:hypothetical protein
LIAARRLTRHSNRTKVDNLSSFFSMTLSRSVVIGLRLLMCFTPSNPIHIYADRLTNLVASQPSKSKLNYQYVAQKVFCCRA